MRLSFPNTSRSFDEAKSRVRFWGYDSAIEISFFVEADALKKFSPLTGITEAGFLSAFDAARQQIHKVAEKVYARNRKNGSYSFVLVAADF